MKEFGQFLEGQPLPPITPGEVLRETPNFQVVTDYKPGLEGLRAGERFYIAPVTTSGKAVLSLAAFAHNIFNFNIKPHPLGQNYFVPHLRADYIKENIPPLFRGTVQIPIPGEDTIPSIDRMETCIERGSEFNDFEYTFSDNHPKDFGITNPHARHLRLIQMSTLDEIPRNVIHSSDKNPFYKARKGWWYLVFDYLDYGIKKKEFTDPVLLESIQYFFAKFATPEFSTTHHLTTAEDISAANALLDKVWEMYGNK